MRKDVKIFGTRASSCDRGDIPMRQARALLVTSIFIKRFWKYALYIFIVSGVRGSRCAKVSHRTRISPQNETPVGCFRDAINISIVLIQ